MAEWERREERIVLQRVTYVIPSGAGWDVVQRALHQATAEWRELGLLQRDAEVPPDAVTWHGTEEGVVVRFEAIDVGTDSREAFERRIDGVMEAFFGASPETQTEEPEPEPERVGDQPVEAARMAMDVAEPEDQGDGRG